MADWDDEGKSSSNASSVSLVRGKQKLKHSGVVGHQLVSYSEMVRRQILCTIVCNYFVNPNNGILFRLRKDILTPAPTRMNLEDIMLSDPSQAEGQTL